MPFILIKSLGRLFGLLVVCGLICHLLVSTIKLLELIRNGSINSVQGLEARTEDLDRNIITTASPEQPCLAHTGSIRSVVFTSNDTLASGSNDKTTKLWSIGTAQCIMTLSGHTNFVVSLAFDRSGLLASGSDDKTIKLWNITATKCITTLRGHTLSVSTVAFSSNGLLASGSRDNTIKLWSTTTFDCLKTLTGQHSSVTSIAFSDEGMLVSGAENIYDTYLNNVNADRTTWLWNTTTGKRIRSLGNEYGSVNVAFSKQGLLAVGGYLFHNYIKVWNTKYGHLIQTLHGHNDIVKSIAFSDNGLLASGSLDKTIKLWDTKTGECVYTLKGHSHYVYSVSFSSGGILASGSRDHTIKLWNTENGYCTRTWGIIL